MAIFEYKALDGAGKTIRGIIEADTVKTARAKLKNHDTEFRFRPDSDFWWLTGFDEPESVLVLLPALASGAADRSVLFLRDKKREEEVWTGTRLGVAAAPGEIGVEAAHRQGSARDVAAEHAYLPRLRHD